MTQKLDQEYVFLFLKTTKDDRIKTDEEKRSFSSTFPLFTFLFPLFNEATEYSF